MKIHFVGFSWRAAHALTLDQLFGVFAERREQALRYFGNDRLLYVGTDGEYHVGLFLTVKDQRKSTELKDRDGKLTVSIRSIEAGTNMVDFNFFAIHRKTQRGIYQWYSGSPQLPTFCGVCRRIYRDTLDEMRDAEMEAVKKERGDVLPRAELRRINSKYRGKLDWSILMRKEELEDILQEMDRVTGFGFELEAVRAETPSFMPLNGLVRTERRKLFFRKDQPAGRIIGGILDTVRMAGLSKGKIYGKDRDGEQMTVDLCENPAPFGATDYDEVATEASFDLTDVTKSSAITQLLDFIRQNKPVFETQTAKDVG